MSAPSIRQVVRAEEDGVTLAALVREALAGVPWSKARDLCRTGRVRVDGATVTEDARRMKVGETVEITPTGRKRIEGALEKDALLHVDGDVVVVRKPPGLITVPFEDTDRDTLVDRVRTLLSRMDKARGRGKTGPRDQMVGVVQRLDKDTTGVLVFARNMVAKRALEEQLRAHTVERRYRAIAHGDVTGATHETFLVQNRGDGLRGSWGRFPGHLGNPPGDAKQSVTHVRTIERLVSRAGERATLVECRLETGRQHQIRIHLAESGHPLVGEEVYIRDFRGPRIVAPRPMLHAMVLGFVHPRTGERVRFEDPPPDDFQACLAALSHRTAMRD